MISNLAYVHPDAIIGKDVTIEPFAYIDKTLQNFNGFRRSNRDSRAMPKNSPRKH